MPKTDVQYGDRLISVQMPATPVGFDHWHVGGGIREITVGRIPGPHEWVLTAQITFEDSRPDIIIPLYMVERFEIQYGD
jgi:hypothetical protein